jgi:hypothetical protein
MGERMGGYERIFWIFHGFQAHALPKSVRIRPIRPIRSPIRITKPSCVKYNRHGLQKVRYHWCEIIAV